MSCFHRFNSLGFCKECGASNITYPTECSPFEELGQQIGKEVAYKNKAYGDSFAKSGEIIKILYPDGIKPDQYDDALAVIRIVDKLFRVATDRDAFGESPFRDIAGYGILGAYKSKLKMGMRTRK